MALRVLRWWTPSCAPAPPEGSGRRSNYERAGHATSSCARRAERRVTFAQIDPPPRGGGFGNGECDQQTSCAVLDRLQRRRHATDDIVEMIELRDIGIDRGRMIGLGLDRLVPVLHVARLRPLIEAWKLDGAAAGHDAVAALSAERKLRRLAQPLLHRPGAHRAVAEKERAECAALELEQRSG